MINKIYETIYKGTKSRSFLWGEQFSIAFASLPPKKNFWKMSKNLFLWVICLLLHFITSWNLWILKKLKTCITCVVTLSMQPKFYDFKVTPKLCKWKLFRVCKTNSLTWSGHFVGCFDQFIFLSWLKLLVQECWYYQKCCDTSSYFNLCHKCLGWVRCVRSLKLICGIFIKLHKDWGFAPLKLHTRPK